MRAGALNVRVATSSLSDFRSTVVRFFMGLVHLVEARVPELAVLLEPRRLFLQPAPAELAGAHAPDLLRGDEPRLLQDADVLLDARQGHVELLGEVRNRSVCSPEVLQNAASGGVGECGERRIEAGLVILNHMVQYTTH